MPSQPGAPPQYKEPVRIKPSHPRSPATTATYQKKASRHKSFALSACSGDVRAMVNSPLSPDLAPFLGKVRVGSASSPSIIDRGETNLDVFIIFAIGQFMTLATARLNRNIDCKHFCQMSKRRPWIGPIDIVVIGFLKHKRNQRKFAPPIAIDGKTRALQGVAQANQRAVTHRVHGTVAFRQMRDLFTDQADEIVNCMGHMDRDSYPSRHDSLSSKSIGRYLRTKPS